MKILLTCNHGHMTTLYDQHINSLFQVIKNTLATTALCSTMHVLEPMHDRAA